MFSYKSLLNVSLSYKTIRQVEQLFWIDIGSSGAFMMTHLKSLKLAKSVF